MWTFLLPLPLPLHSGPEVPANQFVRSYFLFRLDPDLCRFYLDKTMDQLMDLAGIGFEDKPGEWSAIDRQLFKIAVIFFLDCIIRLLVFSDDILGQWNSVLATNG
jgi:hypothetical protein